MWVISVPLAYFAVTYKLDETLGLDSPLVLLWLATCVGESISLALMALAITRSNWTAIVQEAIESASIGEEEDPETVQLFSGTKELVKSSRTLN
jgi:hypothetical protein